MSSQNEIFVCECDEWLRSACKDEEFFKQHLGKNYCVLHYPDFDKIEAFNSAIYRKRSIQDYDFKGVWFPKEFNLDNRTVQADMDFSYAHFSKPTKFSSMRLKSRINFSYTCFEEIVYFNWTEFHTEANFFHARFVKDAWFYKTEFQKKVDFGQASFESKVFFHETNFIAEADFRGAKMFDNVSYKSATFQDYLSFDGHLSNEQYNENTILEFQYTRFKKPELISFHSMNLSPSWFVDVDTRKLVFTNSTWNFDIKREIKSLETRGIYYPEKLFRISCHQLATNMEENSRYDEASNFRQIALEMERVEKSNALRKSFKAFSNKQSYKNRSNSILVTFLRLVKDFFLKLFNLLLHYFYMITSFYGESWHWALCILFGIWLAFAITYTQVNFSVCPQDKTSNSLEISNICQRSLYFGEAMKYSFGAMFLQKSETRKPSESAEVFVLIENVLAPIQFALLALAIRRKFMR